MKEPERKVNRVKIYPAPNESLWWLTFPPVSAGSDSHNVRVNGTGNTVLHLSVQLGKSVFCSKKQH